ncbi:lipopolysaccharide biosynthesis protein [Galbibacter sp. BG1]
MEAFNKRTVLLSFAWSFIGQIGYMIITLVTNIVLARILSPIEFGQIGVVMFFILIAKVLSESGLAGALVRKKNASTNDYSTVFIFNLGISIVLTICLFISSNIISAYYENPKLEILIKASSFIIILYSFQIIQKTVLIKRLEFKKKTFYELISVIPSSVISIVCAYNGIGVWSVIIFYITNNIFLSIILWSFEPTISKLVFNKQSFKEFYNFGLNTTLASLLDTFFDNIYQLILGKYFSLGQTGLFYQAKKLQEIPTGLIKSTTLGVVFSSLSKLQDDISKFKIFYQKTIKQLTILIGLICLLLIIYAKVIIIILYGEKWIEATYYLQLLSIAAFFYIQEIFHRLIFKVFDKTQKILILEILKKIIQSSTIVIGLLFTSIEILLYGFIFTSISSYLLNYYYSTKIYDKFSWHTIRNTFFICIISIITVVTTYITKLYLNLNEYLTISFVPAIILIYLYLIKILNISNPITDFRELKKLIFKND